MAGSTSGAAPVTVNPTTSATTLTVAPLSSSLGTPEVVTANVVDGNGLPVTVGTVTFSGTFNGAALAPQTVNVVNGAATATFPGSDFLLFGSGAFTAAFAGSSSIDDSSAGPVDFTVTKAVPNIGLSTTVASNLPVGTTVPVLATLTPPANVNLTITGEIEFFDNGTLFDTEPVKNGTASTTRILTLGSHVITATYEGDSDYAAASTAGLAFSIYRPTDDFSVGAGAGGFDSVSVYNSSGQVVFNPLYAFSPDYTSGVRVATADFNGDGIEDVALGSGPGTGSRVRILSGKDGSVLADFSPFGTSYTGGVFVAAGDVNGDGIPDLVVTPDEGGGARVRVYSGKDFSTLADFFAITNADGTPDMTFRGGARAAVGDINGDGFGDIVVAAGYGGGPRIAVFSGKGINRTSTPTKLVSDFFAFESSLRNGTYVAVGDINGDGYADIVVGAGPGGGPRVSVFSGEALLKGSLVRIADFFAGNPASRSGVPVATRYLDSDTKEDLVTGSGAGGDTVTAYLGADLTPANIDPTPYLQFDAFTNHPDDSDLGVYVG